MQLDSPELSQMASCPWSRRRLTELERRRRLLTVAADPCAPPATLGLTDRVQDSGPHEIPAGTCCTSPRITLPTGLRWGVSRAPHRRGCHAPSTALTAPAGRPQAGADPDRVGARR